MENKHSDISEHISKKHGDSQYRRGYCQGYYKALEDLRNFSSRHCEKHLIKKLNKWRFETPNHEVIFPPELADTPETPRRKNV
jgi:hypothetical protein